MIRLPIVTFLAGRSSNRLSVFNSIVTFSIDNKRSFKEEYISFPAIFHIDMHLRTEETWYHVGYFKHY